MTTIDKADSNQNVNSGYMISVSVCTLTHRYLPVSTFIIVADGVLKWNLSAHSKSCFFVSL